MAFQFLAPFAPVLKLAGAATLLPAISDIYQKHLKPRMGLDEDPIKGLQKFGKLFSEGHGIPKDRDILNAIGLPVPSWLPGSTPINDYDNNQGAGLDMEKIRQLGLISDYDNNQGADLDMDEIRRLGLLYQNVSTPTPTPVVVPVIEGMSEWEAAKKAQDMALADQLGMEIWARENPGLAAAVAERARIRGTNQTDNPLMRDFRSQLPSPTDSTATTGIPAIGFQSLLANPATAAAVVPFRN